MTFLGRERVLESLIDCGLWVQKHLSSSLRTVNDLQQKLYKDFKRAKVLGLVNIIFASLVVITLALGIQKFFKSHYGHKQDIGKLEQKSSEENREVAETKPTVKDRKKLKKRKKTEKL